MIHCLLITLLWIKYDAKRHAQPEKNLNHLKSTPFFDGYLITGTDVPFFHENTWNKNFPLFMCYWNIRKIYFFYHSLWYTKTRHIISQTAKLLHQKTFHLKCLFIILYRILHHFIILLLWTYNLIILIKQII